MKFKNETDKLKSFSVPSGLGVRWITFKPNEVLDVPDEFAARAKAQGFAVVSEKKVPVEPKPEVKKKSKKKK